MMKRNRVNISENHWLVITLSILCYAILLLFATATFWRGPFQLILQNETRFITEDVQVTEDIYPQFTVCKIKGFKKNYTNYDYFYQTRTVIRNITNTKDYNGDKEKDIEKLKQEWLLNTKSNLLTAEDLIYDSSFITDIYNSKVVPLNHSHWKAVTGDSRYTGNCFSVDSSVIRDSFGEKSDFILIIIMNPDIHPDFSYFLNVHSKKEMGLNGLLNMKEAKITSDRVDAGTTVFFNVEAKYQKRFTNCTSAPDYSLSSCLHKYLDEKYPLCKHETGLEIIGCNDIEAFSQRMDKSFELKLAGFKRFYNETKCQVPCEIEYFELDRAIQLSTAQTDLMPSNSTVIYARLLYNDRVTMFREEEVYRPSMLLTDVGGIIGLFLGASMWSVVKNVRKYVIKFLRKFQREK